MASPERGTPRFFEKPWNSSWGRDENSSMHYANQVEQSTDGYSLNGYEPSYGTDVSVMKCDLDISLDLDPKCVIDYLTSQNESLIADSAPMHLRNDAPSEVANLTPTHFEFSPTTDFGLSIVQPLSASPVTVTGEWNTNAEWLERELCSLDALSDATQFAVDTSADLQNGFSPVAELASIEILDQQQQQVESSSETPNEQATPADDVVVVDPFFDAQIPVLLDSNHPRSHTTLKYAEEPPYVCGVEGYGEQLSRHEIQQEHLEVHLSDQTHASSSDGKFINNWPFENQVGEKKFVCYICEKKFTRHEGLNVHMTIHTGNKMFACPICGKNFARREYIRKHMVVHTAEKKFKCDVCNKEFARLTDLKNHMVVHTGKKTFACTICGKNFGRRVYLNYHMAVHSKENTFTCEICGKKFTCDSYLRQHLKVHNKEKKTIRHEISGEEFTRDSYFRQPVTFHTEKKKFACDVCNKSFARVRYLAQHMKVHTDEKEFECDVCGKTFACKIHLKNHVVVHTKEKKFACDICNIRFGREGSLKRHRAIHTGVQKFTCEFCNKKITRSDNLIAHLKTHQNE